jgi:phosphoglycerate dehydrogenase-like enzyme
MPRIVVTQPLYLQSDQIERLRKLGAVKLYEELAEDHDAWLARTKGYDIICSGKFGLMQRYDQLRDVFVSLPFVGVSWLDKNVMKANNITVANAPGGNKDAVSEWIIGMMINLVRELPGRINVERMPKGIPSRDRGLSGLNVTILGAGNIGRQVGTVCEAMHMQVSYFRRGNNLLESVKDADVIINCLGQNDQTVGVLDDTFFKALKKASYFISITSRAIFDEAALFEALDSDRLHGAAIDCGDIQVGDSENPDYTAMRRHPKIMATPHLAYNTDQSARLTNDIMIDNIEAWLHGSPQNLI